MAGGFWGLSGLTFFRFARAFLPGVPAAAAALVYLLLPYHLGVDWFVRQAAGEFAAYAFVPLIARGLHGLLTQQRLSLGFPAGVAGLALCHLPTALLAGHVFAAVTGLWAIGAPRAAGPALIRVAGLALLGLSAVSLYWLPAMALIGEVSPQALAGPHLSPERWLFGDGRPAPDRPLAAMIFVSLAGGLAAALLGCRSAPDHMRRDAWIWIGLPALLCAAMMSVVAWPIWQHWVIAAVQFPFRLMVFVDFAAALGAGFLVRAALRGRRLPLAFGLAALLAGFLPAAPRIAGNAAAGMAARGGEIRMFGAPEYLPPDFFAPIAATLDAEGRAVWEASRVIASRSGEFRAETGIDVAAMEVQPRRWTVQFRDGEGGPVVLPVPYWHQMRAATAAGASVPIRADPRNGLLVLEMPPGIDTALITLPWHWSERSGAGLSLAALALLGWLAGRRHSRQRDRPSHPDLE